MSGLGRTGVGSQYSMAVQRPKKRKKSSDPLVIDFDVEDAQDGLMDEHDLNDIVKMIRRMEIRKAARRSVAGAVAGVSRSVIARQAAQRMTKEERRLRALKGWETRRSGGKAGNFGAEVAQKLTPEQRSARSQKARLTVRAKGEAEGLVGAAKRKEPAITNDLKSVVANNGGRMSGLQHRFKKVDSLTRKLLTKAQAKNTTPERYAKTVGDALRYTAVGKEPPPGAYANLVKNMIGEMMDKGYEIVRKKNGDLEVESHWLPDDAYNGIHILFESPTGQLFEMQIHTPESLRSKRLNHPLYEEFRDESTTPERRRVLASIMTRNANVAPQPEGSLSWAAITPKSLHELEPNGWRIWRDPSE